MIFADGKGGKMEQLEKWCWVHKKACLVTGIMGLLLAPFYIDSLQILYTQHLIFAIVFLPTKHKIYHS